MSINTQNNCIRPDSVCHVPVDDGWTFRGFIEAVPNLNPDIRFTYRPCVPEERSDIVEKLADKPAKIQDQLLARALAARIKSWDIKGESGEPAPITGDFVRRLQFPLFDRLTGIVIYGNRISDTDPQWTDDECRDKDEAELEAALTGTPVTDALVDQSAKNSNGG